MDLPALELHPDAVEEAAAAREWYAKRSEKAANAFAREIDRATEQIRRMPQAWPAYLSGTRQYLLRRFPYLIVYRETDIAVQVIAFAHARRRPGYWRRRLPEEAP